jgi:peptide/nickel transport system permease protein
VSTLPEASGASRGPSGLPDETRVTGLDVAPVGQPTLATATAVVTTARGRRARGVAFWVAIAWLALVVFAALFADALPLTDPHEILAGPPRQAPTLDHPMGTDRVGHDIFTRVVHGARVSVIVAVVSVASGLIVGGGLGVLAGYYRGRAERAIMWTTDVLLAFPALVFALAIVSFAGAKLSTVVGAIAILSVPAYTRIARANALTYSEREFVLASKALGARDRRVIRRELLPNVGVPLIAFAVVGAAVAIVAEGSLSFLGLGVPNDISWGGMIAQGREELQLAPQSALFPLAAMFLTSVALNLVGDRLGVGAAPRESGLA